MVRHFLHWKWTNRRLNSLMFALGRRAVSTVLTCPKAPGVSLLTAQQSSHFRAKSFLSAQSGRTTVDEEEVKKFSAIAEQWWDLKGDFAPLHAMNPVRVQFIKQHIQTHYHRFTTPNSPTHNTHLTQHTNTYTEARRRMLESFTVYAFWM